MTFGLQRAIIAATGVAELAIASTFYFRPETAFRLLGRPLLDPVIARQYGLFLVSVALMYGIWSLRPLLFRRLGWVALAQRAAELSVAFINWWAGEMPWSSFAFVAVAEAASAVALILCMRGGESAAPVATVRLRSPVWLARALIAFGGLQLFWAVASTIFVQVGTRLLGWKLQDAYTTQQQGIALLVIGLTSLLAASDVRRYRWLIAVPVSSQALGLLNGVNELRLGTISLTIALVQWAIESAILVALIAPALTPAREVEGRPAAASPLT